MTMAGGATVGYCATGRLVMAAAPSTTMNSAMTHAKMGRSMKNREFMQASAYLAAEAADAGALAGVAGAALKGTGLTGALGRIFWKPSTTTCSPSFRPPV